MAGIRSMGIFVKRTQIYHGYKKLLIFCLIAAMPTFESLFSGLFSAGGQL